MCWEVRHLQPHADVLEDLWEISVLLEATQKPQLLSIIVVTLTAICISPGVFLTLIKPTGKILVSFIHSQK